MSRRFVLSQSGVRAVFSSVGLHQPRYFLNVQRNFTAIKSLCGTMLVSCGFSINRCQPRFHTMKRSLPGLMVQRSRVFVPMFCDSVSYWTKLDSTRFGL